MLAAIAPPEPMTSELYRVGGSLRADTPTYVTRQADRDLLAALHQGEFCYVFEARQMGKSSLLARAQADLQRCGVRCVALDMTAVGGDRVAPSQWYYGILAQLWRGLAVGDLADLKPWWQAHSELSWVQRLSQFIADRVLASPDQRPIAIFIDEIDSALSLPFAADDFFVWIRWCYNQRSLNSAFQRLRFALFGVATPADLIRDKTRTPFNIGTPIALSGFTLAEAAPLAAGLDLDLGHPQAILAAILDWTGGQPFLTQKLCQQVVAASVTPGGDRLHVPPGLEAFWVESVVRSCLLHHWQRQDEPEHLRTIRDRLLRNERYAGRLLGLYQRLCQGEVVACDDSREQSELLLSGLVVRQGDRLAVKNRLYREVFNLDWVQQQLRSLRPYSETLQAWLEAQRRDDSRLLRGQALQAAQDWAQGKSLSDLDYQFLAASAARDRREAQARQEARRLQETARWQRRLLGVLSVGLGLVSLLGAIAFSQFRQARWNEQAARLSEVQAIAASSQALFASNRQIEALLAAMRAQRRLEALAEPNSETRQQVAQALQQAIYWIQEQNHFSGHDDRIWSIVASPDGRYLATTSTDRQVKLWQRNGQLLPTFEHEATTFGASFHPRQPLLAVAQLNGEIAIWNRETGERLHTLSAHEGSIWSVHFSPDGRYLASTSADATVAIWRADTWQLERRLRGHRGMVQDGDFSPDSQFLVSASLDNTARLWSLADGSSTMLPVQAEVYSARFDPNGQQILTGDLFGRLILWDRQGRQIRAWEAHETQVSRAEFSPDGRTVVSTGKDDQVKFWRPDGQLLRVARGQAGSGLQFLPGAPTSVAVSGARGTLNLLRASSPLLSRYEGKIWLFDLEPNPRSPRSILWTPGYSIFAAAPGLDNQEVFPLPQEYFGTYAFALSADGKTFATAGTQRSIQLWSSSGELLQELAGHESAVPGLAFSPEGELLASASEDTTVRLWRRDGTLLKTLDAHTSGAYRVAFRPDGQQFASTGEDGKLRLWRRDGTLLKTLDAHTSSTFGLAVSPDGNFIATGGLDGTVKLWRWDGTLVKSLEQTGGVAAVAFSPDSQLLAAGGLDNKVGLFQMPSAELLKQIPGFDRGVWALTFSADGLTLGTATDSGAIALWNVPQLLALDEFAYACSWLRNYLQHNHQVSAGDRQLCPGAVRQNRSPRP